MDKTMKIVQVVFNYEDPDQLQQYNHVKSRKNKSGYLKRLIQRDIEQQQQNNSSNLNVMPVSIVQMDREENGQRIISHTKQIVSRDNDEQDLDFNVGGFV